MADVKDVSNACTSNAGGIGDRYELRTVIISNGYYGSCGRCTTSNNYSNHHRNYAKLDENASLLGRLRPIRITTGINIRIFSLGVLFIGGVSIGGYLLYRQAHPWPISLIFDFVKRDDWGAINLPTGKSLVHSNVMYVLLYHTGGQNCNNFAQCQSLLKEMQLTSSSIENSDIPFNFLIGGDGRTYEARGWATESGIRHIRTDSSIAIAFTGNFTTQPPPIIQTRASLALISELLFQRKVSRSFSIFGIKNITRSHNDGDALFRAASNWEKWDEVISVF